MPDDLLRCPLPECSNLATEFWEFNHDEGIEVCADHMDVLLDELKGPPIAMFTHIELIKIQVERNP